MDKVVIKVEAMFAALCIVLFVLWWIEWPLRSVFKTLETYGALGIIGGLGVVSAIGFYLVMEIHNMITRQGRWK